MTKGILKFSYSLWKTRCEIVQAEKDGTAEPRTRILAYQSCRDLQKESWKMNITDRHLLRRRRNHFMTTALSQIVAWDKRVKNALQREEERRQGIRGELSHWITTPPTQLNSIDSPKLPFHLLKYKQLTIFGQTLPQGQRLNVTTRRRHVLGNNSAAERIRTTVCSAQQRSRQMSTTIGTSMRRTTQVQQGILRWLTATHARFRNRSLLNTTTVGGSNN